MKLTKYASYEQYIESQRLTDKRKKLKPCLHPSEVSDNASWLRHHGTIRWGMCHGARQGQEVDWFQKELPTSRVWGTDLFPKGHSKVIEWDFSKPKPDWVGKFGFVYSNALDHAMDPLETLRCWFDQLTPSGHLLIQWSRWHINTRGGDCFGAYFHEYVNMLNSVGLVVDVNYHWGSTITIVSRKR